MHLTGGSKKYKEHKKKAITDYEKRQHLGPAKTKCLEAKLKGLASTEETIISMDEVAYIIEKLLIYCYRNKTLRNIVKLNLVTLFDVSIMHS